MLWEPINVSDMESIKGLLGVIKQIETFQNQGSSKKFKMHSLFRLTWLDCQFRSLAKDELFRSTLSYTPTDCFTNTAAPLPQVSGAEAPHALPKQKSHTTSWLLFKGEREYATNLITCVLPFRFVVLLIQVTGWQLHLV